MSNAQDNGASSRTEPTVGAAADDAPAESAVGGSPLHAALHAYADPMSLYEEQKEAMNAIFTRAYLQKLMAASNGNQSLAARTAGLDRTYLGRLLLKYGMRS